MLMGDPTKFGKANRSSNFSKAFDKVNHVTALLKLVYIGQKDSGPVRVIMLNSIASAVTSCVTFFEGHTYQKSEINIVDQK